MCSAVEPHGAFSVAATARSNFPTPSSQPCCKVLSLEAANKVAFRPTAKRKGSSLRVVRSVLNNRKLSISDNGASEPARILLERLFAQTQKLEEQMNRSRDIDCTSSDPGSGPRADIWLERAELLQSLLGSGTAASLDDIADKESSPHLRHRLIVDERYSMAVYTCKKCRIDVVPVAWGHALIWQHYAQAHVKFKIRLQHYAQARVKFKYEHLAKSAPTILDDSVSADAYLNVLHMPTIFPRSERSRRSHESANRIPLIFRTLKMDLSAT
ncbi:hypothetical protein DVH24_033402 [Malus domestica]|uniref:Uncharacterized protein n=1 Tax=Malus domestica TaxID=3750 RepID=A0A498JBJ4_MALDO|nr:hypothetical protein DVH24_033402 [Malus domestica]